MRLSTLIHVDSIVPELASTDRDGAIRELAQSLADHGAINPADVDTIVKTAIQREHQGSTGFGRGVAVPHVKHECVRTLMATLGRSSKGIEFAALDRAPVYTVFLLLSPKEDAEGHLAAMERIFRHLQRENFRRFLRQADTKQAIIDLLIEADEWQED